MGWYELQLLQEVSEQEVQSAQDTSKALHSGTIEKARTVTTGSSTEDVSFISWIFQVDVISKFNNYV
jgi:hypothetical protein